MTEGALLLLTLVCTSQMVTGGQFDMLSAASFRFSQKLYRAVALPKSNIVYSPFSIHSVLCLAYYGARDETAKQMARTLELTSIHGYSPHAAYRSLILQMTSSRKIELLTANALFLHPKYKIQRSFVRLSRNDYFSDTLNLDLHTSAGPERSINEYVDRKTHHRIHKIFQKGSIPQSTALIIVGTFFFNGTWAKTFDPQKTHKKPFHVQKGDNKTFVNMMSIKATFPYKEDRQHKAEIVELPFVDKRFGLFIVLPRTLGGIGHLEKLLTSYTSAGTLFTGLRPRYLHVEVPKFKIETSLPLKHTLLNMGMQFAFLPQTANFNGISSSGPHLTDVQHKAVIEVQETGTVASATTYAHIRGTSRMLKFTAFIVNHPFIFFLRDKKTNTILFQGKFSGCCGYNTWVGWL